MKTGAAVVAALVWTLLMGLGGFALGMYVRGAQQATKEVQTLRSTMASKVRKDSKALAAGLRAEKDTASADQSFQKIRTAYEDDLQKNPRAGCVLDVDSLRRWNDANTESATGTPGEPAGGMPAAAEAAAGAERGDQPH